MLSILNIDYSNENDFVISKPQLNKFNVTIGSFIFKNTTYEELWCKLKSQDAISSMLKLPVNGTVNPCGTLIQKVLQEAIEDDPSLRGIGINILKD